MCVQISELFLCPLHTDCINHMKARPLWASWAPPLFLSRFQRLFPVNPFARILMMKWTKQRSCCSTSTPEVLVSPVSELVVGGCHLQIPPAIDNPFGLGALKSTLTRPAELERNRNESITRTRSVPFLLVFYFGGFAVWEKKTFSITEKEDVL